MDERHIIKVNKANNMAKLQQELHALKSEYTKTKRELGAERDIKLQEFGPRRQRCNCYFDAAVEITRQAIAKLIKNKSDYYIVDNL